MEDTCQICGGELQLLGTLGKQEHYRCRACGMESSSRAREEHEHEEQELKADAAARVIVEEGLPCLLLGAPGSGKTLIAKRVAKGGVFRAPHNTVSLLGMVGQYSHQYLRGELALADGGVLFLDEADEFRTDVLHAVQLAIELGEVYPQGKRPSHERGKGQPASVLVIATCNASSLDERGPKRLKQYLPGIFESVWLVEKLRMKR